MAVVLGSTDITDTLENSEGKTFFWFCLLLHLVAALSSRLALKKKKEGVFKEMKVWGKNHEVIEPF